MAKNIVWATKLRGGYFGQHDRNFDLLVAFESDFGGLALRAYRFVTEDEGPPIPTPLSTLHPVLEQLDSNDLIHPIYLNRDASAPLVRIVDERLVEYAQFSEDENPSSSLWKQMKVSSEVERAIYSQLSQQIVVVGQPNDQGSRSVFVVSTATTEGKFNLWALEPAITLPANTRFYETSQAFYTYNLMGIWQEATQAETQFNLRLHQLRCLAP